MSKFTKLHLRHEILSFLSFLPRRERPLLAGNVSQNNHIMKWEASELIIEQESDKFKRWIKESICIRSNTPTMNRDEGTYQLSPIWTQVISTPKPGGGGGRGRLQSDFARLSQ